MVFSPFDKVAKLANPAPELPRDDREADDPDLELPKIIKFEELARCGDEIWIEYERKLYRLRRTRQGKLILTK